MRPRAQCPLPLSFPPSFDFSLCLKADTDSIGSLELLDSSVEVSLPLSLLPTQHPKCEPRSCQGAGLTRPDFAGGGGVLELVRSGATGRDLALTTFVISCGVGNHREQPGQCGVVEGPRKSSSEGFLSEMGETKHNQTKRQRRWMRSQAPAFGAAAFDCNQLRSYKVCCVGATFPFVPLEASLCPLASFHVSGCFVGPLLVPGTRRRETVFRSWNRQKRFQRDNRWQLLVLLMDHLGLRPWGH